jgi:hypothetical protein
MTTERDDADRVVVHQACVRAERIALAFIELQ